MSIAKAADSEGKPLPAVLHGSVRAVTRWRRVGGPAQIGRLEIADGKHAECRMWRVRFHAIRFVEDHGCRVSRSCRVSVGRVKDLVSIQRVWNLLDVPVESSSPRITSDPSNSPSLFRGILRWFAPTAVVRCKRSWARTVVSATCHRRAMSTMWTGTDESDRWHRNHVGSTDSGHCRGGQSVLASRSRPRQASQLHWT